MAKDNRSSRKVKDGRNVESKKKSLTEHASPAPSLGPTDSTGLRRSARDTSSRKQSTASPSNTRKSERLEKQTPTTPPVKNKSDRIEKQMVTSPLRRSDRGKKHTSSGSSGSKKFVEEPASSITKSKKVKGESSLKQCAVDVGQGSGHEREDSIVGGRKRKKRDARSYKALFKPQRIRIEADDGENPERQDKSPQSNAHNNGDADDELKRPDKLPQINNSSNGCAGLKLVEDKDDGVDESGKVEEVDNQAEVEESDSKRKLGFAEGQKALLKSRGVEGAPDNAATMWLDDPSIDFDQVEQVGFSSKKSRHGESVECSSENLLMGGEGSSSERKMSTGKTDASSEDGPISHASLSSRCQRHDYDETCIACSKKQRINRDLEKQQGLDSFHTACNNNLQGNSGSKGRGTCEAAGVTEIADKNDHATMLRKETSSDGDVDGNGSICITCKLGGKLRCCDAVGCNRYYHLCCLNPPLVNAPLGVWHCPICVKKIELGVPSISAAAESILDTREVEVSDAKGLQKQKQYLVQFKDLGQIHSRWVIETQLLLEAPQLVENFSKKDSMTKCKEERPVPDELLKKRLLLSFKPQNENQNSAGKDLHYHYEWLVKWQGLDNDQATWEPENSSFLSSPEGQKLVNEYQDRHEIPKAKVSPIKLPPGIDNIHLSYVKKLHDCWNKCQSSVVFDYQERATRIVLFILSLKGLTKPLLLITTSNSLSQWEAVFLQLAPFYGVKVSCEDTQTHGYVRLLEFHKEGGQLVFQALLYSADASIKDLNLLESIKWEALIVDECQCSMISNRFNDIKRVHRDNMLLLFCGSLGENMADYLNVLSLLGYDGDLPNRIRLKTKADDRLAKLKEALSQFTAYELKSDYSKFVEFWVPVQISNLQLEQYCATLHSNSMALSSCSKGDKTGTLHDLLISNRKCCDHPYIVDPFLQGSIRKDLDPGQQANFLDIGIKASGKLHFLDLILPEMKKQQRRVLILFQPMSGSGKGSTSIGDILDDFIRYRFGEDTYERVDGVGLVPSKKQAALNNFNKKDMGRFIFLLEYRACHPSIKLSSVDMIIIFDSDWNPSNDLRALQRISIDSQFEQIVVFRLYTSCTLEEKILRLAECNVTLDSKLQNLSRSTSDELLTWGASYLFDKLHEFHSTSIPNISSDEIFLNKVREEFLNLISHIYKSTDATNSIITRARQICGTYTKNLPLPSELNCQLPDGEQPHMFWKKLFEGRHPQWKYLSVSTPRQRKRALPFEEPSLKTSTGNDDIGKKRRKTANNNTEPAASKPILEEGEIDEVDEGPGDSFWSSAVCDETTVSLQKSLHSLLKPEVSKLYEILKLPEDVKIMVEAFLEYVIDHYRVNKEPATTLQAFLISLCWIGSSLLKHKIDMKESFALAKKYLNFSCKEEEANSVYSKLEPAKEMFVCYKENQKKCDALKNSLPAPQATSTQPLDPLLSHSVPLDLQRVKIEIVGSPHDQYVNDERIFLVHGQVENRKLSSGENSRSSKQKPSRCETETEILDEKIQKEIEMFNREWDEKRKHLESDYTVDKAFIRTLHSNPSVRSEKLKVLEKEFVNRLEEHERQRHVHLKDFKGKLLAAEGQMEARCNSSTSEDRAYNKLPLPGSQHGNQVVFSEANKQGACDSTDNAPSLSGNPKDVGSPEKVVHDMQPTLVVPAGITGTIPNSTESGSIPTEATAFPAVPNAGSDAVNAISSKLFGATVDEQPNRRKSSSTGPDNVEVDGIAFEKEPDARNEEQLRVGRASSGANDIESTGSHTSEKQVAETTISCVPAEGQQHENIANDVTEQVNSVGIRMPATVYSTDNAEGDTSEKQMTADAAVSSVPTQGIPQQQHERSPRDVAEQVDSVGIGLPAVGCNAENAEAGIACPDSSHAAENQDDSHSSSSSNSPSTIAPQEKVPSIQPFVPPASDHSEPTNTENQNESLQQLPYSGILDKDIQGNPSSLAEVEVETLVPISAGQDDQFNSEDPVLEPNEEPHVQLSTSPPVAENQTDIPASTEFVLETTCEGQTVPFDAGPPSQTAEDPGNPSDIALLQTRRDIEERPLSVEIPLGDNLPHLHTADRVDHQLTDELHSSSQNSEAPSQALQVGAGIQNRAALQPWQNLSDVRGSDNHNLVATQPPSQPPASSDPLQAELERLCEVKDNVVKVHEETKLRLKSECEKELAEMIAQINNKYEAKCRDAEAAFQLKKKEIDINLNRVVMNKILAEAFRSKCQDLSPSGPAGMQQVTQAGLLQHLHQFSVQSSLRSSSGVVSSSPGQASGRQHVTMRQPHQIVHQPAALFSSTPGRQTSNINPVNPSSTVSRTPDNNSPVNSSSMPTRPTSNTNPITPSSTNRPMSIKPSSTSRPPANINPSSTSRPPPNINLSSTSRPPPNINPSSMPGRPPPNINPITPSTGNLRVGGEIRRPAPHIRPFRPSTSAAPPDVPSYQQLVPSQHIPSSLPLTSATLSQASARLPLPPTSANHCGLPTEITPSSLPATSSLPASATSPPSRASSEPTGLASAATPTPVPSLPPPLSEPLQQPPSQVSSRPHVSPSLSANHGGLPSQQSQPSSLPVASSSLPQASTQTLLPRIPAVYTNHAGLYSVSPRPESGGTPLPDPDDLGGSLSALDLLMEINDQAGRHQPNILPPPPDVSPSIELDPPALSREGAALVNSSSAPDVVCLSDDD